MPEYNEQILNNYFTSRDYLGAANYLKQFKGNSPKNAQILRNKISELEREGEIQNAILEKTNSQNEKDAFHFISAINGKGSIPHTIYDKNTKTPIAGTENSYGDKYLNLLNNLKADDGSIMELLKFDINNDDVLYSIYEKLGTTSTKVEQDYNIRVSKNAKTGHSELAINTRNTNFAKILSALPNVIEIDNLKGQSNNVLLDEYGKPIQIVKQNYNYQIKGVNREGKDVTLSNYNQLSDIKNLYNNAIHIQKELLNKNSSNSTTEETIVSPFLGAGQIKAHEDLGKGLITQEQYNAIVKERTTVYNTLLAQSGLSQYKVYASSMDDDESEVMKELDNSSRKNIMKNILYAMKTDRITYSTAVIGGETGTYITITPDVDKDKEWSSGEAAKGYRIFVPGLFKSSCDAVLENRTELKSVRDFTDMQRWNYAKNLQDGTRVGYNTEYGSYKVVTNQNGDPIKIPISKEEMLARLNKNNIIEQSANIILANIGTDGKLQSNSNITDIKSMAKLLAAAGIAELNNSIDFDELDYVDEENDIYNRIIDLIQSNMNLNID